MSTTFQVGRVQDDAEMHAVGAILAQVFNIQPDRVDPWLACVDAPQRMRVVRNASGPLGGLVILPMGQFFGGRSVPMAGIAAVGISPPARSRGAASALMRAGVRELHDAQWPLSALYPATLPLYRRVGYESAGSRWEIKCPLDLISARNDDSLELRMLTKDDEPAVRELYRARAVHSSGNLDRNEYIWSRVDEWRGDRSQGCGVFRDGRLEGYVFWYYGESPSRPYSIMVSDIAAATPPAGRGLLRFFADHRSMADTVTWCGSAVDPIFQLADEKCYQIRLRDHWMLRIVDVKRAIPARGYPAGVRAELHLDVRDELVSANAGRWAVRVTDGAATIEPGGRGSLAIDINGLAAIYTGHASPREVVALGRASGDDESLAAAGTIFAGPAPWMPDMF